MKNSHTPAIAFFGYEFQDSVQDHGNAEELARSDPRGASRPPSSYLVWLALVWPVRTVFVSSGALTGSSVRRAGSNSQRRSGRRPALRREPAPGNVRSSFVGLAECARPGGEPLQLWPFGTGVFAVSCCSPFSCLHAAVRPRGCVAIASSCQSLSWRRSGVRHWLEGMQVQV